MPISRLLIANRGEIAIRIARAAAASGIASIGVYSEDDASSPHLRRCDESRALKGRGAAAYLDIAGMIDAARDAGCDAVHPGYGFLSERADFAQACTDAGLTFVGPSLEALALFGDKARARELASSAGVAVLPGTGVASAAEVRAFYASIKGGAIAIKAVGGGGGRGMRIVEDAEAIDEAYERCQSEARTAFGDDRVYAEGLLTNARHIEVQLLGDGKDVVHLGERDCTLQRRYQKLIEVAPAPFISDALRKRLFEAALAIGRAARLDNACTIEFLVDPADETFFFVEANARLQVEHTVTEEVTGIDIVRAQLALAGGATLGDLGLAQESIDARGCAVQCRVNMETIGAGGMPMPSGGTIGACEWPAGPGVRVDAGVGAGYTTNPAFDTLAAKVIVTQATFAEACAAADRALGEVRLDGVVTNIGLLRALLRHADVMAGKADTRFVEAHIEELLAAAEKLAPVGVAAAMPAQRLAGARIDSDDPLAVLDHGKRGPARSTESLDASPLPEGSVAVRAPIQGTIISVDVTAGADVRAGERLLLMEAMKMEHVIAAPASGHIQRVDVRAGDTVFEGHTLVVLDGVRTDAGATIDAEQIDLDHVRPDLEEALARHAIGLDDARPDAVERRRGTGQRTARENIADLCDDGSFVEYGPLVIAAQRRRRSVEELIEKTPADGLVGGIGTVNADVFGPERSRVIAMSYDYTVLAGTQGSQNHRKKDRLFELAERWRLPLVFFTEGGGGRPGDTDGLGVAGLDCMAFALFGGLSGLVPLVGIVSGRCFAGNAALLGCCDVVIATKNANIGMGGPAMIEGGGLGVFRPEEVGPASVQYANGVIDVLVDDESAAVRAAKQYLSYFQGPITQWDAADQRRLRSIIPENRRRMYDVRSVIETMADAGTALELRRGYGPGMVTALCRIEGRPIGVIANNPAHLAGAIDSDGADKAARFMQLCDAFDLPLLFLCDTPGIMVGPESEKTALVRHASRMFVTGASLTVPVFTIVLRKGYGLGAQAMAGGSFKAPVFTVAWPTGEFGGMGLEGAVKLGYRNELAAIDDAGERKAMFEQMVDRMYQHGKAVNAASHFEIDDVIDPADSRRWISGALRAMPPALPREGKKRPNVDTW